jgi:hypothetical protein
MISLLGWFGTILYLMNHAYLSFHPRWQKGVYYWGNFIAATSLVISSWLLSSWQAVAINGFWALISVLILMNVNLRALPITSRRWLLLASAVLIIALVIWWREPERLWSLCSWFAAMIFASAYLVFSAEKLAPRHYQIANVIAAILCMPQLWLDTNYAVFFLEVIWSMISAWAAIKRYTEMHLID